MGDCCTKMILCTKEWQSSKIIKRRKVPRSCISHTISQPQNSDVAQRDVSLGYAAPPCDFNEKTRNIELIRRSLYKTHKTLNRNTFPQNSQKEPRKILDTIKKAHQNTEKRLLRCKSSYKKHKAILRRCTFINLGIGNRYTKLYQYLHSYNYDMQYKVIQDINRRSLVRIKELMKSTTKFGLTQLSISLLQMIFCIKEMKLFHNLIIDKNIKTNNESVPLDICNSNDAYNDNISKKSYFISLRGSCSKISKKYFDNSMYIIFKLATTRSIKLFTNSQ